MIVKGAIHKSPFVGVFAECNEEFVILPSDAISKEADVFRDALNVTVHKTLLGGSALIGSLMVLNNTGAVITDFADEEDVKFLKNYNLLFIKDRINAVGNDILVNDTAAVVHPDFKNESVKLIGDVLGVEVIKKDIGGIKTVGSAAVITKKGMVVNPQVLEDEVKFLESYFKIPVHIATANFGSLYVGASVVANSKGAIIGELSTTIEVSSIEEMLL